MDSENLDGEGACGGGGRRNCLSKSFANMFFFLGPLPTLPANSLITSTHESLLPRGKMSPIPITWVSDASEIEITT